MALAFGLLVVLVLIVVARDLVVYAIVTTLAMWLALGLHATHPAPTRQVAAQLREIKDDLEDRVPSPTQVR
jgi:hypothetical protein